MARIRTIKPEFFTDSKITALTPLARLFYVSLWCEADRAGRLRWDPVSLKFRYLPADKAKVEDVGAELIESGLVRLYQIDGHTYADIPRFVKHQVINNREAESSFPAYNDDACVTRESGVSDAACGKEGREGKGRKGTAPVVPKGTTHSEDFLKFWEANSNKVGKDAAWKAWQKRSDRPDLQTILAALDRYARTKPADREWCNPATWLNQGRWNDAPAVVRTGSDEPVVLSTDSQRAARLNSFNKTGYWLDAWGPKPEKLNLTMAG